MPQENNSKIKILLDNYYSGMYRLKHPDGSISDMVNIHRATDVVNNGPHFWHRKLRKHLLRYFVPRDRVEGLNAPVSTGT